MKEKSGAKSGFRHWVFVVGVVLVGALLYLVLVGPRLRVPMP